VTSVSAALEAILFSSNRPLKVRELQQATDSDRNSVEELSSSFASLWRGAA